MLSVLLLALLAVDGQTLDEIVREPNLKVRLTGLEKLRQRTPASDAMENARVRIAMAGVENSLAQYDAARQHAQEALQMLPPTAAKERSQAMNHTGNAYLYQSRYPEALENYEESLRVARGGQLYEYAALRLNNIGSVHYFAGNYAAAFGAYEEARRLVQEHDGEPWAHKTRTTTLVNQATILQRLNRLREALQVYQEVRLQIQKDPASSAGPVADAQLLANSGALYRRLGDPYKALKAEEEALSLFERAQYRDGVLGTLSSIAITTFQDLEDRPRARQLFQRILEETRRSQSPREEAVARLNLAEIDLVEHKMVAAQAGFSLCLESARKLNLAEEEWRALFGLARLAVQEKERSRALQLLQQAAAKISDLERRIQPGKVRVGFLSDKRQALDLLIQLRLEDGKFDSELLQLLESSHSRSLRPKKEVPRLEELQRSLAAGATILLTWAGPQRTALIPLTRDSAKIYWLESGYRTRAVRAFLARFPGQPFFAPLRERLKGVDEVEKAERLTVIPDQWLATIPWQAPPAAAQLKTAVRLLPSVALFDGEKREVFRWPWQNTSLAVAVAQPQLAFGGSEDARLAPLPRVAAEAAELGRWLPGKNLLLADGAATKAAVLAAMPQYGILHIAAHSVADPADAGHSRLLLSDSPLLASELTERQLDQLELVVLSACSSAQGELIAGEGIEGLTSTFLKAGAANVIGTLWPVPDEVAAQWSSVFYEELGSSVSIERAVGAANAAIEDPVHRNAFVLWGNGGMRIQSLPVKWIAAGAGITAILLMGFWFSSRRGS